MELALYARGACAGLLVVAAVAKMASRQSLLPFLLDQGLARGLATVVNRVVVPVELGLAAVAVSGVAGLAGDGLLVVVAASFVVAQVSALVHRSAPCHCFGSLDAGAETPMSRAAGVARAGLLMTASLTILVLDSFHGVSWTHTVFEGHEFDVVSGAVSGLAFVLGLALIESVDDFNRRRIRALRFRPVLEKLD
jgi:hypothetical protein